MVDHYRVGGAGELFDGGFEIFGGLGVVCSFGVEIAAAARRLGFFFVQQAKAGVGLGLKAFALDNCTLEGGYGFCLFTVFLLDAALDGRGLCIADAKFSSRGDCL